MAQVTVTKLSEGPASVIVQVDLLNNDNSPELVNYTVLSPSMLDPPLSNTAPTFRIAQIWYSMAWFDIALSMGGPVYKPIWTMSRDTSNHIDFRDFGGLTDLFTFTHPVQTDSGSIQITTNGFATAGSMGHFVLELRKLRNVGQ